MNSTSRGFKLERLNITERKVKGDYWHGSWDIFRINDKIILHCCSGGLAQQTMTFFFFFFNLIIPLLNVNKAKLDGWSPSAEY